VSPRSKRTRWRSRIKEVLVDFPCSSGRLVSTHRQRRKALDRQVSDQSRRGLDLTNFFLADVQVSFGSFLAFYLGDLGWSKQDVGLVLTVGGLAGVAAQIPGGALADAVWWKRGLAALGILLITASALILALWPSWPLVLTAEILHGASGGIVGPAIAAISLGLAGRQGMALRVGRNFPFRCTRQRADRRGHGRAGGLHIKQRNFHRHRDLVHPRFDGAEPNQTRRNRLRPCTQCEVTLLEMTRALLVAFCHPAQHLPWRIRTPVARRAHNGR
jgi:hypothetical protein